MLLPLLLATPWLGLLAFLLLRVRPPREIPPGPPARTPSVSVIVPARNEAANIEALLASLAASRYPAFEVVVVDDRSEDGTARLARRVPAGGARRVVVLDGSELPAGWLGKPWACHQGAVTAAGELLLFTDADTRHGPDLLERAVAALEEDGAEALTVTGVQVMETFWERLVQPQVFFTMVLRFYDAEKTLREGRWRDAIANGQFFLFRRETYDAIGGHVAVRDEVVEDLALAQRVLRDGRRLSFRMAETALATRMYRSLADIVEGWSKNLFTAIRQTVPPAARPLIAPLAGITATALWIVPPAALVAALAGVGGTGLLVWSATAAAASVVLWTVFTVRMGTPFWYGPLYPLGAVVGLLIFARSWRRGRRVEWKGRTYVLKDVADAP